MGKRGDKNNPGKPYNKNSEKSFNPATGSFPPHLQGKSQEHKSNCSNRRIHVTLYKEQLREINKYKGLLGESESEIIRTIIVDWLLDRKLKGGGK